MQKATKVSPPYARKVISNNVERANDTTVIGKLYFFKYDPKWKHKLAHYDKFPMVFPIEPYPDGFLGLNLHYLSVPQRRKLTEELLVYRNNNKMDQTTKLKLSYQLLKNSMKLNTLAQPCIHRYLFDHVRSEFIEVYAEEFDKAVQIPVEDWVFKR